MSGTTARSAEAFVEECYQRFLHRPADDDGMAFYAGRLREGASRMDVVQTFVTGREFFALLCRGEFGDDLVDAVPRLCAAGTLLLAAAVARGRDALCARRRSPADPRRSHGVDLDVAGQLRDGRDARARSTRDLHFDADRGGGTRYYWDNDGFGPGDAVALAAMMRHASPSRIIEVGAGYSTAVMLDVAERHLAAAAAHHLHRSGAAAAALAAARGRRRSR